MRKSLVLLVAVVACSSDPLGAFEESITPKPPTNPLVSLLASEPQAYVMTRLGSDESSPYRINDVVCNGLPTYSDVVDSIFFNGDGTYRRVYRSYNLIWRTMGVPEPEPMNGRYSFEQKGAVDGEGDVLKLILSEVRQNDAPFEPYVQRGSRNYIEFRISGTILSKPETLGTGCMGERTPTTAVFTRAE